MQSANKSNEIHAKLADSYGFDLTHHFPARTRFELLKSYCRADMDILDVGCANGLYTLPIAQHVKSVTGIDISQEMLDIAQAEAAQKNVNNVRFINTDGQGFDFGEDKYDVIYCFAAFLLFPDADEFLRACHRGLKKDGVLILDVLNRCNLSQGYWKRWYASQGHHLFSSYKRADIDQKLKLHGLMPEKWVRQGFAEQWKYLPLVHRVSNRMEWVNKIIHWGPNFDLDYMISNTWPFSLATNRWYIVSRKQEQK